MNFKRILSAATAVCLSITMLAGCGSSGGGTETSAETSAENGSAKVVNIAIQPSAAFIPLYIAREKGWIEEELKDQGITVNWNDFESGPPMNESLAAGSSDIGVMGDVPTVSAIAAGQNNEVIALAGDGPNSCAFLVKADSDMSSAADLKGKKVGTVVGSTAHNLADKLLKTNDLDINTDVELVNIAMGDAVAVLSNDEVDAVIVWEPNITRLVESGTAKIIGEGSECGFLGLNPIVARAEFAQNNPEIIKVIIEQYARGAEAMADLDDETTAKIAEILSIEVDQVAKVAEKYDYDVTISEEDVASLQDTITFLVKIGVLTEEYEIDDYVKTNYVESAELSK